MLKNTKFDPNLATQALQLPLISVVMAAYNEAPQIRRAVESIRQQTWQAWEMIVVDDASTDGTWDILHEIAAVEPRIQLHRNPQNVGAAVSWNYGLAHSRGEFIARMDADDEALPDRFRIQMDFLQSHPEIDVLGGGAIEIDDDGKFLGEVYRRQWHQDLTANIYKECPFIHPTVLGRARFWRALGGYEPTRLYSEDYNLWLRGYRQFIYHNLPAPLIWYSRQLPKASFSRDASYTIWTNIRREQKVLTHGWYALRPLVAYWVWKIQHG